MNNNLDIIKEYQQKMVKIIKAAPDVYFRKADLKTRRQCNGAYFVGLDCVAAVDAPPGAAEMFDEAIELFGKPLTTVFLTHGDGDHCEGLSEMLDRDITVYCARRLYEHIVPPLQGRRAAFVAVDGAVRLAMPGGMEICMESLSDTSHSPYDMIVGVPGHGVGEPGHGVSAPGYGALCTGDFIVEYQTAYFHNANIDTWISTLKKLSRRGEYGILLPGHMDAPVPFAYVGDFCNHLEALRRAALTVMDSVRTLPEDDIGAASVRKLVDEYFNSNAADAAAITARAGAEDAAREVRMILWRYIHSELIK